MPTVAPAGAGTRAGCAASRVRPAASPVGQGARRASSGATSACRSWRERQLVEAGRLGQPVRDVERLDRLAGGALDEVVDDAESTRIRPVRSSNRTWIRAWLLPVTCLVAGGASTTWTNGSPS